MQSWKEQIAAIEEQRTKVRQLDEQLYADKTELLKTEKALQQATRGDTRLPADAQAIAALKALIAQLQQDLQQLNTEMNALDDFQTAVNDTRNRIDFLKKKIATAKDQIAQVNALLDQERHSQNPDPKKIKELEAQLKTLQQLLAELEKELTAAEAKAARLQQQQQEVNARREQLNEKRKDLQGRLSQAEENLGAALQSPVTNTGDLEAKRKELIAKANKGRNDLIDNRLVLQNTIGGIYVDPHPRELLTHFDDNIPFLMMPVRIETRFIATREHTELWLRIYPDDIAVHTHEETLTGEEVTEGVKYWTALFDAEKNGGAEKEDLKKTAWGNMVTLFGPQRSAWVASQTQPPNWHHLDELNDVSELHFPEHDLTKTAAWSRAPRTRVLPDRFVVMLYEGNTKKEIVGNPIPDELFVGPDPMEVEDAFLTKEEKLVFGEAFDWTSNFDKAVQYGMGFKIPLNATQAVNGFDKILVLGLNLSTDENKSKAQLEELINNHHYSPKGFSLIKQGAPTNNTEADGSGYTKNDPFNEISYFVETQEPMCFPGDDCDCDGKNLADALGIDYVPLEHIHNCDTTDYTEAVAMNAALYPSTLGFYFGSMLSPALAEEDQDKLRDFFVQYVTGRGPLPALRVGNQPYGVLLTSDFSNWQWQKREEFLGTPFLNKLYTLLSHYQSLYESILSQLMYVGKPGEDPSKVLMDILGLQSGSASFYQRVGYSTDYLKNLDDFQYNGKYAADISKTFDSKNDLLTLFNTWGNSMMDDKGVLQVPQQFRLIFQHYQTLLDAANLVDNVPLSEKDGIHYYNEAEKKNYLNWLKEANTIAALEKQDFGAGIKAPSALLYMQLRRALVLQIHDATLRWFRKKDIRLNQTIKPVNFHNIRPQGDLTKWEVMKAKVSVADPNHWQKNKLISEYLLSTGKREDEAAFLNKIKESLDYLSDIPTARLERCFTEHLDSCTYRLDAWQTALFNTRLRKHRQLNPEISHVSPEHKHDGTPHTHGAPAHGPAGGDAPEGGGPGDLEHGGEHHDDDQGTEERKTGIYLASFGWLENVKPASRRQVVTDTVPAKLVPKNNAPLFEYIDNGGFVHAPSLNQASAAAVLRSGYMSHATPASPDTMAVNLSSERVRRALFILQGIRNGQALEALLGYQFERGLHDRASANNSLMKLNLYIYNFRDAYPFNQHRVRQQGTNETTEAIPANNVVNGVKLAEVTAVFPFGATGAVVGASPTERLAIIQEKDRLADTLDAVKDLLLSESMYQVVQGNYERAAALVNALKDAQIPPDIDIINTSRGHQFTFTNRVTIHFDNLDPNDPGNNPWTPIPMTPRAKMEPGINQWLKGIIGPAEDLIFHVAHLDALGNEIASDDITIDKLQLQPIDIVYITGNELNTGETQNNKESKTSTSELESRIAFYYRQLNALDDAIPVKIEFLKPDNMPGKKPLGKLLPLLRHLKSLIADSRPLHAQDYEPHSKTSLADKNNPKGYDAVQLLNRITPIHQAYQLLLTELNNTPVQTQVEDENGVVTVFNDLKDAVTALIEKKLSFSDVVFTLGNTEAAQLQSVLMRIAVYGLPDSFPQVSAALDDATKTILLDQAKSVSRRMTLADTQTTALLAAAAPLTMLEGKIDKLIEAGKTVLSEVFNILPLFAFNNEADIQQSNTDRTQLFKHATDTLKMVFVADEWMQNAAHVRPKLARWDYIRTLQEMFDATTPLTLDPVQLPYRAKDSWLAVAFPDKDPDDPTQPFNIAHDTLSVCIQGKAAFLPGSKQAGILIDDWTEEIPTKQEVTGISFNYNQPNAAPPQALLLAVTPRETGSWDWDKLVGILNDTLKRAKLRAVEPQLLDKVNKPELGVLLPALLASFNEYDLDVSLDYRLNLVFFAQSIPILSVMTATNN
jgi:predicted  nucleic acid-binding Zn-ribbon protein